MAKVSADPLARLRAYRRALDAAAKAAPPNAAAELRRRRRQVDKVMKAARTADRQGALTGAQSVRVLPLE